MSRRGRGEGSIYKRTDGRWAAAVDLGWVKGKRQRKVVYGKTRSEVATKLLALHNAAREGHLVLDERCTLGEFLNQWLHDAVKPNVRPRTLESYETVVRVHLVPTLGHFQLGKLRPQHVEKLLNARSESGLSPRTVDYIRSILGRALKCAVRWDVVATNVVERVARPRQTKQEIEVLSSNEARKILTASESDPRLGAAYTVALTLGLRRGEILGLQWDDIDFETAAFEFDAPCNGSEKPAGRRTKIECFTTHGRAPEAHA